jgi:tRNA-specific 2-thiouridylase
VKFGAMKEYAQRVLKVDAIATGHYARLWHRGLHENNLMGESSSNEEEVVMEQVVDRPEQEWILRQRPSGEGSCPMLLAGADTTKDQSYFLVGVSGAQFQNVYFPLGHLQKRSGVRELARTANLPTAEKRDSMGICFVGKRNFSEFISEYLPVAPQPGHFVNIDTGEVRKFFNECGTYFIDSMS